MEISTEFRKGTLTLVSSKNPPRYETPMEIRFWQLPSVDEGFKFVRDNEMCRTTTVQNVHHDNGEYTMHTLNSVYKLKV